MENGQAWAMLRLLQAMMTVIGTWAVPSSSRVTTTVTVAVPGGRDHAMRYSRNIRPFMQARHVSGSN